MKSFITLLAATVFLTGFSQVAPAQNAGRNGGRTMAQRKFEILVNNVDDQTIVNTNDNLEQTRSLGIDMVNALSASSVGQVAVLSTKLIAFGSTSLMKLFKGDQEEWYKAALGQCKFVRTLKTESKIDDFYSKGSVKGAMDPENLKFKGFGCRNYIESTEDEGVGNEAFYLFCSMRRDTEGLAHIINHSKFLVEIDTLMFAPQYCNLPNDSTGRLDMKFDFKGRKNLVFNIDVKIYSSWVNEAIMITDDELLGQFSISAIIDSTAVKDGKFIYSKNSPINKELVNINGDCFIVPRSFTGTTNAQNYTPAWGTGQYRVEMTISESCMIDDAYYQVAQEKGKKVKWDKQKWEPEWKQIKAARKAAPNFGGQAWNVIKSGYVNNGWAAVFIEPVTTTLIKTETTVLSDILTIKEGKPNAAAAAAGKYPGYK